VALSLDCVCRGATLLRYSSTKVAPTAVAPHYEGSATGRRFPESPVDRVRQKAFFT
jgi:hypothetical protein